jgi:hypothetical protein
MKTCVHEVVKSVSLKETSTSISMFCASLNSKDLTLESKYSELDDARFLSRYVQRPVMTTD